MAEKSCVICGGEESEGELLIVAPCRNHWVCPDDIASFFERATDTESLFPPNCCGQMFVLEDYEDYVPFDIAWSYQVKEQGEYAVLAKFRIYCGNSACGRFLHPSSHVTDPETSITYAICNDDACGKLTCTACRALLHQGTQDHICKKNEDEEIFKQTAAEHGYQECSLCGATVELIEACNHISCECGHDFCYICGRDWTDVHSCPYYGAPTYDGEGYNQDGYHRDTGLDRDGLTRAQDNARHRGDNPDEEQVDEEEGLFWEVLQHITPEQRVVINNLMPDDRRDALDQLRIELLETLNITFDQAPPLQPGALQPPVIPQGPVEPQTMQQHIEIISWQMGYDTETSEQISRERAQELSPQSALELLRDMDPDFDPELHTQIDPQLVHQYVQYVAQLHIPPLITERLPQIEHHLTESFLPLLIERAAQLPEEQANEQGNEQDENQEFILEEHANDNAEAKDENALTFLESSESSGNFPHDNDDEYTIDDASFQGRPRFTDDQSEKDDSDLYDDPHTPDAESKGNQPYFRILSAGPSYWPEDEHDDRLW